MDVKDPMDTLTTSFRRPSAGATAVMVAFLTGVLFAALALPETQTAKPPGLRALNDAAAPGATSTGAGPGATASVGATSGGGTATATQGGSGGAGAVPSAVAGGRAESPSAPGGATAAASTSQAVDNTKLPNGGATARGVTATEIKIGVGGVDPSVLAPVCPRCDPKEAKQVAAEALVTAWKRDGILPVHGRTIKIFNRVVGLTPEEQRSACLYMAQEVKPFVVIAGAGTGGMGECAAAEFKLPVVDAYGGYADEVLRQNYPLIHIVGPAVPRVIRNFVHWADDNGLLKGQVLGMHSSDEPATQTSLNKNFRDILAQKGYKLTVDNVAGDNQEAAAASRFKAAGVTVAFVFGNVNAFQRAAEAQSYKPKYPLADVGYTFGDALQDLNSYPPQMDGNIGMGVRWWNMAKRKPATPADNNTAAYCFKAYSDYTKKELDSYDHDAELHLLLNICTGLEVTLAALKAAGPEVTTERFIAGLQTIKNMETSEYVSVSFAPGKYAGSDSVATVQHKAERWQPDNNYWKIVSGWRPMWLQ